MKDNQIVPLTREEEVWRHMNSLPARYVRFHVVIDVVPSDYLGYFERVTDVIDGAAGDDDYDVQPYTYTQLKWSKL